MRFSCTTTGSLLTRFSKAFVSDLSTNEVCLWTQAAEDVRYTITLGLDRGLHGEGDLVMYFRADGKVLFDLAFTLAPARVVRAPGGSTLLIARVQGRPDLFEQIRRATRSCGDIFPGQLLLSAAEGVARALSISSLCGVRGDEQLSSRWGGGRFNYDAFWSDLHGERRGAWLWRTRPSAAQAASTRCPRRTAAEPSAGGSSRKPSAIMRRPRSPRVCAEIARGRRRVSRAVVNLT